VTFRRWPRASGVWRSWSSGRTFRTTCWRKGKLQRLLEILRARFKAGEECASGRLTLTVVRSAVVGWEKLVRLLISRKGVAAAIAADREAVAALEQADRREPAAEFVSERVTVDVVAAR
jgi:hypothetical protein